MGPWYIPSHKEKKLGIVTGIKSAACTVLAMIDVRPKPEPEVENEGHVVLERSRYTNTSDEKNGPMVEAPVPTTEYLKLPSLGQVCAQTGGVAMRLNTLISATARRPGRGRANAILGWGSSLSLSLSQNEDSPKWQTDRREKNSTGTQSVINSSRSVTDVA